VNERDLLGAGAVLPLATAATGGAGGAVDASAEGDVLVARGYRHAALDERVVVRLVPEALGEAEDLALEFLGFAGDGGERVGRVRRQSLGFPAWALVHDPANGRHALAVVKEMERLARLAATRPGHAKDGFDEIAARLDRSVPHFLPTYYEEVARHFLAAESTAYASAFFGKARQAERRHALEVDEERLRDVFLEFAAAGALSGKALREQARGLAERLAPQAAFEQFRTLCLERAAAGLAPYAGMLEDLRRLARTASLDVAAEEVSLLTEILPSGAITRAPLSFWKTARPALISAAGLHHAVRVRLLHLLPAAGDRSTDFDALWLETLESAGAFELLARGKTDPAEAGRTEDAGEAPTAARWFSEWAMRRQRDYRQWPGRMLAELRLVERFAAQLVREGNPVRLAMANGRRGIALDLLDTCLAAGVPVTDPHATVSLDLGQWLTDDRPGRRDLAAVAADPRFAPLLRAAVERLAQTSDGPADLLTIAGDPVLGPMVGQWLSERAADLERPLGLPELERQLTRLAPFTDPSVLATAPGAAKRIAAADPASALARTLRAGILDELGWPALDEAVERLRPVPGPGGQPVVTGGDWPQLEDAWPALVVAHGTHVIAVGPDGVLDDRTLTLPAPTTYTWARTVIRWTDGQWLIASGHGDARRATWSGRPADAFRPQGTLQAPWRGAGTVSMPLPGGGRFYGTRPMHVGDSSFGERRPVASDGIAYWVQHENRWFEYDPAAARRGRASVPAFFDSALAEGVPDAVLVEPACRLLPVRPGLEGSPFGSKDGRLGWWVRYDPAARTLTACSVDGSRSPALPCPGGLDRYRTARGEMPLPPLRLPGTSLYPVVSSYWTDTVRLHGADGLELGTVEGGARGNQYSGGTEVVPPLWYWHALRPRDEAGSAVLRSVTHDQAAALLAALPGPAADAVAAVRRVLPGITHPGLVKGVAALAAEASRSGRRITAFARKAAAEPRAARTAPVVYATDGPLQRALTGLLGHGSWYSRGRAREDSGTTVMDQVLALHRIVTGGPDIPQERHEEEDQPHGPFHRRTDWRDTTWLSLLGQGFAAAAARAASPGTGEDERRALLEFLGAALDGPASGGAAPLADPRGRLRMVELCEPESSGKGRRGRVRRTGGRTLVALSCTRVHDDRQHWTCVEYAPDGRFGPWEGSRIVEEKVAGTSGDPERTAGIRRLTVLLRERGPVPYRPAAAERFAELTGVDVSLAALLLLGLPRIDGYGRADLPAPETLALAGLRPARAVTARGVLRRLGLGERTRLLARLVPADPAAADRLWEDGFDVEALADEWLAIHGGQRPVPIELVERAEHEMFSTDLLTAVTNPERTPHLTGRTRQRVVEGELVPEDPALLLAGSSIAQYADTLRWLAYRVPYGDPLRAVLPETLRTLRARLGDEGLLLDLGVGWTADGLSSARRIREAHGLPATGGGDADGRVDVGPAFTLLPARYGTGHEDVWLRSAPLLPGASASTPGEGGPDHPALTLLAGLLPDAPAVRALRDVLSDGFAALVAADGPAGAPQDPGRSVPGLVAEAAERLDLSADAAALYLMLLALPDPTDRNLTEWTAWKPARTKRARTGLAATDLVVEAKRSRAGRTLFLPGGWLDRKAPRLPVESWKAGLFAPQHFAREGVAVPDCPVPELFRRAWRRVVAGDAPGFEEFAARRTGRGRR
jgi:hypothetical protein